METNSGLRACTLREEPVEAGAGAEAAGEGFVLEGAAGGGSVPGGRLNAGAGSQDWT